jgi:hypothetical protein
VRQLISLFGAVLLAVASVSWAQEAFSSSPGTSSSATSSGPQSTGEPGDALKKQKLQAEIAKLEMERESLELQNRALGIGTRRFSAIIGAIGGFTGAILTFLVGYAGLKLKSAQDARLRQEKDTEEARLSQQALIEQKRLDQDRELDREKQTLEVFRDLGSENPRTQIAAASLLLQRLKSYEQKSEPDALAALERPTVIKVLVSILKEKRTEESNGFDTLRKYIADNLIEPLRGEMRQYDWQNVNLSKVWWQGVDARGVDFYQANLREAGLRRANLQNAVFYEADLSQAVLRDAKLGGANFYGANLDAANLNGAEYDDNTTWPDDFKVEASGAIKVASIDMS